MKPSQSRITRPLLPVLCSMLAMGVSGGAFAADASAQGFGQAQNILHKICARQFEVAQKTDMESFRDYDAETFRAGHDDRTITVFDSGATRIGIDAVMAALASHFANREAKWSWTERYRVVDGCRSAYIAYETVYEIPRIGYRQKALTGVTYTHDGFKWLAIADQGTKLP
ncbi:MAG: hypothetical protein ACREP7_17090 [Lysobacter sp.]